MRSTNTHLDDYSLSVFTLLSTPPRDRLAPPSVQGSNKPAMPPAPAPPSSQRTLPVTWSSLHTTGSRVVVPVPSPMLAPLPTQSPLSSSRGPRSSASLHFDSLPPPCAPRSPASSVSPHTPALHKYPHMQSRAPVPRRSPAAPSASYGPPHWPR